MARRFYLLTIREAFRESQFRKPDPILFIFDKIDQSVENK